MARVTPPSTCNSSYGLPSIVTLKRTDGKKPGIAADAMMTSMASLRSASVPFTEIAPMSQTTRRFVSRFVVPTYKRRPLLCSAATFAMSSEVKICSTRIRSGALSASDSAKNDRTDLRILKTSSLRIVV